jgi:hypothetical protein
MMNKTTIMIIKKYSMILALGYSGEISLKILLSSFFSIYQTRADLQLFY